MKRIFSIISQKWPEYLIELVVIVAGIIGAFMLNSWNDARLERQEEMQVLQRVKNDLQNTINEFEFLNGIRSHVLYGTNGLMEKAAQGDYNKAELDSLLGLTMYRPTFNNKMGTIELLFATGKINIIKSDTIKDRLITWPGSVDDTIEEEDYAMKLFQDHYYPKLAEYVHIQDLVTNALVVSFFGGSIENIETYAAAGLQSDYEGLLKDREFLNHLRMRAAHMKVCNLEVSELVRQTKEIIQMIDKELTR